MRRNLGNISIANVDRCHFRPLVWMDCPQEQVVAHGIDALGRERRERENDRGNPCQTESGWLAETPK